jgi:Domain of unknown function (DUF4249)
MKKLITIVLMLLPLVILTVGCNPEKEVEIKLPDYERQLVVECYMEVGEPFRLLVSESIGFFEGADTPIVVGAKVVISHGNVHDTLQQGLSFGLGFKFFNFASSTIVPPDYNTEYELEVIHPDGRTIRGKARVMPKVDMAEMILSYNADSMASLTMRWRDASGEKNYYLLTLHKGTVFNGDPDADSPLEFSFTLDDRIGDGEFFTIGTLFGYESGDTLISTLYHISYDYWRYSNSVDDAISSNGNPFAQPGVIHSSVTGGLGIFTGFNFDRDTVIVP